MGRRGRKTWVLHKIVMKIGGIPLVIPINTVEDIADKGAVLSIMQRLKEREELQRAGVPVPDYLDDPYRMSDQSNADDPYRRSHRCDADDPFTLSHRCNAEEDVSDGDETVPSNEIVTESNAAAGSAREERINDEWTRLWKNKKA